MTTYTLAGHSLYNAGSSLLSTGPSTLSFFVPEGGATTFSYTVTSGLPRIASTSLSNGFLMLDGEPFPFESDVFLLEFSWNDNGRTRHTTMIALDVIENGSLTRESHIFYLDGDALPSLETNREMTDFFGNITGVDTADSPYAPGQNIALSSFFDTASENDTVAGTAAIEGDYIDTGSGDDVILGEGGYDTLIGGAGDDLIVVRDWYATVDGGIGNDTLYVDDSGFGELTIDFAAGESNTELQISNFYYQIDTAGVEMIFVDTYEQVYVDGNDADNHIGIRRDHSDVYFNGGGGFDVLDMTDMTYPGHDEFFTSDWNLDTFLARTTITGSASSLTFSDVRTGDEWAILNDVEQVRIYSRIVSIEELMATDSYEDNGASHETSGNDTIVAQEDSSLLSGLGGDDHMTGTDTGSTLYGNGGADTLTGLGGNDSLIGGAGRDILIGGEGDDALHGGFDPLSSGAGAYDLSDTIYGGDGNDSLDGGYGNDELRGDAGNDTIVGGFGADSVIGGTGDDALTGQAWSDLMFGGDGDDFINGGFGSDRLNGGEGADRFYHLGIGDHGSDWIQDYDASEGDVLVFGDSSAGIDDFQVNFTETANAGAAGVEEAFVIYRPTGQIVWALVDGADQDEITLRIDGVDYDLMA